MNPTHNTNYTRILNSTDAEARKNTDPLKAERALDSPNSDDETAQLKPPHTAKAQYGQRIDLEETGSSKHEGKSSTTSVAPISTSALAPVLLAFKNQDEEGPRQGQGQQLDQSSNALLGGTIPLSNVKKNWMKLQEGGLLDEAKKHGLGNPPVRPKNALTQDELVLKLRLPPHKTVSGTTKLSNCWRAFMEGCSRALSCRNPFS